MKLKNKLLLIILITALAPIIAIGLVFYIIGVSVLNRQIEKAHLEAVIAVDSTIAVVVSDMVNIAFTASHKLAHIIEKEKLAISPDFSDLKKELVSIDQTNVPNVGTGRGLGYHIVIATDEKGYILARSNVVEGVATDISQKGHIFYLDELRQQKWSYSENFGIAFNRALAGKSDSRKIIYNQEFLRREGYGHLTDKYGFENMMGLTAFQPIFSEKDENEQIGILIIITILNNNHLAIGAINTITGAEFTAIAPAGEIMASFFINPPTPTQEMINMAKQRADQMARGAKETVGKDSIFYTKERVYLKPCPGIIFFEQGKGVCYVSEEIRQIIPYEVLEERAYRLHFISEVDTDFQYVSIRGIAHDLTDYDYLIAAQTRYFRIVFLLAFLVVLLISLVTARKTTTPILKFTQEIQKIEKGDFGKKIDIKTGDEIEILVESFNNMSGKIAQNYEEMKEQKDVLEVRVEAKTKELRELANSLDKQVQEKTKELQERIEELEKFQRTTVDRELKMIELKKEIAELKERLKA